MAEPVKISTNKYTRQGKVEIDGHLWTFALPGSGTEMRYSQASRAAKASAARINILDKKIDEGSVTLEDLDQYEEHSKKYEENERIIYNIFKSVFRDNTKDNSEVAKWLDETPSAIIMLSFEDAKTQAESAGEDGRAEPTSSP